MPQAANLALQIAALLIACSGACLIFQQRALALRLFIVGCAIAAVAGATANVRYGFGELALWLGAAGVCAAILGARHWPFYLIAVAIALGVLLPRIEPITRMVLPFWWLAPLLVGIAIATALIVTSAMRGLRDRAYTGNPKFKFNRFVGRLLDRLVGFRRQRPRQDRHIGEFGTTRRGRSGSGPHMI